MVVKSAKIGVLLALLLGGCVAEPVGAGGYGPGYTAGPGYVQAYPYDPAVYGYAPAYDSYGVVGFGGGYSGRFHRGGYRDGGHYGARGGGGFHGASVWHGGEGGHGGGGGHGSGGGHR
jgi:hypothetical protein